MIVYVFMKFKKKSFENAAKSRKKPSKIERFKALSPCDKS